MMIGDFEELEQKHKALPAPRVRLVQSDRANPFPEYRRLGLVGQGQFAQVYCAIHKHTGELAAIKQTRHAPEHPSQEPFVLGELCHPNIVCCQAIAQTQGGYQFVLDYCETGTLRSHLDLLAQSAVFSPQRLTQLALDILNGLRYIHSERVIHGDLKPENILLTYQFQSAQFRSAQPQSTEDNHSRLMARIGDFGSARFVELPSQSRKEIGSPTYAAPERFDGQSSYASDLYSAGIILYELLLGDRPFSGSPDYLRQAHRTQAVPFPRFVPAAVQQFLKQALHKHPTGRFSSADEMICAFQSLGNAGAIAALDSSFSSTHGRDPSCETRANERSRLDLVRADSQLVKRLPSQVQRLLTADRSCFAITKSAVYRLDERQNLRFVGQLNCPSWVAISPAEDWLVALPKAPNPPAEAHLQTPKKLAGRFVSLGSSADVVDRCMVEFRGQFSSFAQADCIQVLAIDRRHILSILTSNRAGKSCLECFTRKGKLIASLPLNIALSHATSSFEPYQVVALSAPSALNEFQVLSISLRPFQVRSVVLPWAETGWRPRGISAFPWGFAVVDNRGCLFLDRSAHPVGRLDKDGIEAIAPLSNGKALIATSSLQTFSLGNRLKNNLIAKDSTGEIASSEPFALSIIDLKALDLDLVF